ncbi:MAG: diacylglycerol kinase family protein [Chloroflexi bacterium]|nr:diacylglycerol kinase family protein [Chloroflexota bacterium]
MNNNATFSVSGRIRSLVYGLKGLWFLLASQKSAWIHAAATVGVIAAGVYFGLTAAQWGLVTLAIAAVWTAEAFNTAFELLADAVSPDFHPLVGKAKDVAAGAVLIAALGSIAIGVIVFGPHILDALTG